MNTAQTILQQLGGNRFLAMTGAKNLVDTGRGLQMQVARRSLCIEHTDADLYDLVSFKVNRKTYEVTRVTLAQGVYADQLRREFTHITGLDTSL